MTVFIRLCGDLAVAPVTRSARDETLLVDLEQAFDIVIRRSSNVDYEDWMEPAHLLHQAVLAGHDVKVLPSRKLPEAVLEPLHVFGTCRHDMR